jgi:hypothetical protein
MTINLPSASQLIKVTYGVLPNGSELISEGQVVTVYDGGHCDVLIFETGEIKYIQYSQIIKPAQQTALDSISQLRKYFASMS